MAVKGINEASKCFVDVYSAEDIDKKFEEWEGITSQTISANANLNDYTAIGFYNCKTNTIAQTVTNRPSGLNAAFCLLVEEHAGVKQTLTRFDTSAPTTWIRNYYGGTWGSWTRVNNTIEDPQIYYGTTTPSSSLGKNGDVYFLYE